ncbi:B-cell receptor-associated protein 31-like-domain-containing protein [Mycena albidolilacea]|uniref:Endoplasmic reticulum transmembrane protein n=1 Tax=Mycena albidolilacea TaxID=1033008 RepID=A0AAD7AA48_9AGAR|nr:B-cell receptor-associated protein 31-like-domain-containing protein [Mycena albidolilacea]
MTIYYSLTFMLLAAEMVTFCVLVFPLPHNVRKKIFGFLSESPIIAKIAYGLKISFIFVAILFADALQRMFRVTAEAELAKQNGTPHAGGAQAENSFAARKFYSQRNTYLTGFTLFLSLVLTRTFSLILDLIHTQEEYAKLKGTSPGGSKGSKPSVDSSKEVAELKAKVAELSKKERDFETLKKQAAQQAAEFDRLATKYNEATGANSSKRD